MFCIRPEGKYFNKVFLNIHFHLYQFGAKFSLTRSRGIKLLYVAERVPLLALTFFCSRAVTRVNVIITF